MKKQMIILATAGIAASSTLASTAQAHGRGGFSFGGNDRFWSGIAPSFGPSHRYQEERHYRVHRPRYEPRYVAPRYIEPRQVEKKSAPAAEATIKFVDGKGRMFDLPSQVWFDGKGQCFTGDKPFAFKNGTWFYGNARWSELNGIWQTAAAGSPVAADCNKVPVFAAKMAANQEKASEKQDADRPAKNETTVPKSASKPATTDSSVKTAEKLAGDRPEASMAPTECKKYFPNVGEVLTVPCTE